MVITSIIDRECRTEVDRERVARTGKEMIVGGSSEVEQSEGDARRGRGESARETEPVVVVQCSVRLRVKNRMK